MYTLIIKRQDKKDIIKTGLDKTNATMMAAELKIAFPDAFEAGLISVEIVEENYGNL